MGRLQSADSAFSDLKDWLSPEAAGLRVILPPEEGTLLRMYPPGQAPRAGSLRSDVVDIDSHWHFHDMHQMIYAFQGAIEVESSSGRHLVPQQLAAWIPAGATHRVSLHNVPSVSVFFTGDMVEAAGNRIRTLAVSPLMREMLREAMRWPLQGPSSRLRKAFFEAMAGLCSEWIDEEADLFLPTSRDACLQRALDFTNTHMDAKFADVCRHAGISERSLRRRLKTETGLTWEVYRQRSRLLHAISLLGGSGEPVSAIAARCGFESPSAFAKAFRIAMGEAPREYRARTGEALSPPR